VTVATRVVADRARDRLPRGVDRLQQREELLRGLAGHPFEVARGEHVQRDGQLAALACEALNPVDRRRQLAVGDRAHHVRNVEGTVYGQIPSLDCVADAGIELGGQAETPRFSTSPSCPC
jgi:hypothetical protein